MYPAVLRRVFWAFARCSKNVRALAGAVRAFAHGQCLASGSSGSARFGRMVKVWIPVSPFDALPFPARPP
eukprot:2838055-Lingulodinium_polyedra.AAC.1